MHTLLKYNADYCIVLKMNKKNGKQIHRTGSPSTLPATKKSVVISDQPDKSQIFMTL